ncbi:hypothetical protein Agub_g11006 [Astrephomene gubernaculifera]|uniref:Uncharacterized protein n=1 Tax=Astrephomene gubernaculifera TaxID=47775 RepID=A0AAD3DY86_9CHLO|nr:hypothetical protein Agub_g11006 [Astrephomene gubernaculifera]
METQIVQKLAVDRRSKNGQKQFGLVDLLQVLATFRDCLIDELSADDCLPTLRLVSRGMRDVVDLSVRHVGLHVQLADMRRSRYGEVPSLNRWPHCSSVTISHEVGQLETFRASEGVIRRYTPSDAAVLLLLPFADLSLQSRQRITELAVVDSTGNMPEAETAVSLLLRRLPALRRVDLHLLEGRSYDRLPQQILYDGLATLPYLEELCLSSHLALAGVETLASGNNNVTGSNHSNSVSACSSSGSASVSCSSDGSAAARCGSRLLIAYPHPYRRGGLPRESYRRNFVWSRKVGTSSGAAFLPEQLHGPSRRTFLAT